MAVDRRQDQAVVLRDMRAHARNHRRDVTLVAIATAFLAALAAVVVGPGVEDVFSSDVQRWSAIGVASLVLAAGVVLILGGGAAGHRSTERLVQLTGHDPLTGLPNRRFLGEGLDDLMRQARRSNGRVGVFIIEVDGVAAVNEASGRDVGDELVRNLAARLQEVVGVSDHLVRSGGSEFMVVCSDVPSVTSAEAFVSKLLRAVTEPLPAGRDSVRLHASIGGTIAEYRCSRPDEVLTDADVARRQAVAAGHGTFALFDRSKTDLMTPSTAQRYLREALDSQQFSCYYQPVVSLWTRRLVGVEALVRWESPSRGVVAPGEFISTLEDTGLIVPVGHWVLDQVCAQARVWNDQHPSRPPLSVKVNVSARQLVQADFALVVISALERHGIPPNQLIIEVSEAVMTYDLEAAWASLTEMRTAGIGLAVDDFGTGFSSLTYLRELEADVLAIDKSFIDGITASEDERTVVRHMIALAKSLGIVTVAEGVEHEEQVEVLRELNCDLAQGYYFSHPQPVATIDALLAADGTDHEWDPGPRGDRSGDDVVGEEWRVRESTDHSTERFRRGQNR